jgi:hypothetical protein
MCRSLMCDEYFSGFEMDADGRRCYLLDAFGLGQAIDGLIVQG